MANEQNLIPTTKRSKSEARANSVKGGIASGKARRLKRTLREIAVMIGETKIANKEAIKQISQHYGFDEDEITHDVAIIAKQYNKAEKGDTQSAKYLSELKGEMKQTMEVTGSEGRPLIPQRMSDEELKAEIERLKNVGEQK